LISNHRDYFPDFLDFGKHPLFITLNCGGEPSRDTSREIIRAIRYGSTSDIPYARRCVDAFCADLIGALYGRRWRSNAGGSYSIIATPETRTKLDMERCPLHYHIKAGGVRFDEIAAYYAFALVGELWEHCSQKWFGHFPDFDVQIARSEKAVGIYSQKFADPASAERGGMIIKSHRHSACLPRAAHNQQSALVC
jgi:hypothetical protein